MPRNNLLKERRGKNKNKKGPDINKDELNGWRKSSKSTSPAIQTVSPSMEAYSLSTPGSMMLACTRIRTAEAPIIQKTVPKGSANQTSGIPMTKRPR